MNLISNRPFICECGLLKNHCDNCQQKLKDALKDAKAKDLLKSDDNSSQQD